MVHCANETDASKGRPGCVELDVNLADVEDTVSLQGQKVEICAECPPWTLTPGLLAFLPLQLVEDLGDGMDGDHPTRCGSGRKACRGRGGTTAYTLAYE
jgi:hypothetical protein